MVQLSRDISDRSLVFISYPFALPGGLGLSGMVTVTRLAANKYEYTLDVPGEVMDL